MNWQEGNFDDETQPVAKKGGSLLNQRRNRDVKIHIEERRLTDKVFDTRLRMVEALPPGTVRSQSLMDLLHDDPVVRATFLHYHDLKVSMKKKSGYDTRFTDNN